MSGELPIRKGDFTTFFKMRLAPLAPAGTRPTQHMRFQSQVPAHPSDQVDDVPLLKQGRSTQVTSMIAVRVGHKQHRVEVRFVRDVSRQPSKQDAGSSHARTSCC